MIVDIVQGQMIEILEKQLDEKEHEMTSYRQNQLQLRNDLKDKDDQIYMMQKDLCNM